MLPRLRLRPLLNSALGLALGACAAAPMPAYLARPADPDAPVPAHRYESVGAGTAALRPVEPKDWRQLNRQVGPRQ